MSLSSCDSPAGASADLEHLFLAARAGSAEAMGNLLERCRHYLLSIAFEELDPDLQAKGGASDLVQDTFLEAQAAFPKFEGVTEKQLLAWLRQILRHNVIDFRQRFRNAECRQVNREVSFSEAEQLREALRSDVLSPRGEAIRTEEVEALRQALETSPAPFRQVIELRHRDHLSFHEIGQRMNRSADATRMLWGRALEWLSAELDVAPAKD